MVRFVKLGLIYYNNIISYSILVSVYYAHLFHQSWLIPNFVCVRVRVRVCVHVCTSVCYVHTMSHFLNYVRMWSYYKFNNFQ